MEVKFTLSMGSEFREFDKWPHKRFDCIRMPITQTLARKAVPLLQCIKVIKKFRDNSNVFPALNRTV